MVRSHGSRRGSAPAGSSTARSRLTVTLSGFSFAGPSPPLRGYSAGVVKAGTVPSVLKKNRRCPLLIRMFSLQMSTSVWDLLAARRARMLSVGLLSGGYGDDELTRAGAFRVYRDAEELRHSLDELGLTR
jgi:hypothetical protein